MLILRLSSLHEYLRLWTNRPYVCIAVCLTLKVLCLSNAVSCRNLIPICCKTAKHGDDCSAIIFVEWTKRCRLLRMNRRYVRIAVYLTLKLVLVFNAVWCHTLTLIYCKNYNDGGNGVMGSRLPSLNGCNDAVGSGRTGRTFALSCTCLWKSFYRSVKSHLLCKYTTMAMVFLYVFVEWLQRWRWVRADREYVCITMCLALKLLFVFKAEWDHNLIPTLCDTTMAMVCVLIFLIKWM